MPNALEIAEAPSRPLSRFLSFRILRAHLALNAQAAAILEDVAGVTLNQWRVISIVGSGDARTTRALAAVSGLDPAVISRTIRTLEERGLIVATRLEEDRRTLALALTKAGAEVFDRTLPVMQARQQWLFDALDPQERKTILSSLEKIELAAERRNFADDL